MGTQNQEKPGNKHKRYAILTLSLGMLLPQHVLNWRKIPITLIMAFPASSPRFA
jgi:hypothetical protein